MQFEPFEQPDRMTKRRRVDGGAGEHSASWNHQQQVEPSLPQFANEDFALGSDEQYAGPASTRDAAESAASTPNDHSEATRAQWSTTGPSPYPDLASYQQQPYFSQRTEPSAYQSPWPPSGTTSYPLPSSRAAMPFFPPQAAVEPDEDFHAPAVAAYRNTRDVDSSPQNAYPSSHSRNEQPRQPASTICFDDASMHLKIQSLSILDNLVSRS